MGEQRTSSLLAEIGVSHAFKGSIRNPSIHSPQGRATKTTTVTILRSLTSLLSPFFFSYPDCNSPIMVFNVEWLRFHRGMAAFVHISMRSSRLGLIHTPVPLSLTTRYAHPRFALPNPLCVRSWNHSDEQLSTEQANKGLQKPPTTS